MIIDHNENIHMIMTMAGMMLFNDDVGDDGDDGDLAWRVSLEGDAQAGLS